MSSEKTISTEQALARARALIPVLRERSVATNEARCVPSDTLRVLGLRGTGSKNVIVRNSLVPEHRILDFIELREGGTPGSKVNTGPLYQVQALANFALCLSSPAVGIAQGAYQCFVEQLNGRANVAGKPLSGFASIQLRVAEAAAMIDAAELLLRRDARHTYETAAAGGKLDLPGRARNRRNHAYAARLAYQATEILLRACGGQALFDDSEIQRCYRDVLAVGSHIGNNWDNNGTFFGAVTLGVPVHELIF